MHLRKRIASARVVKAILLAAPLSKRPVLHSQLLAFWPVAPAHGFIINILQIVGFAATIAYMHELNNILQIVRVVLIPSLPTVITLPNLVYA